jgi:hypothetical protein
MSRSGFISIFSLQLFFTHIFRVLLSEKRVDDEKRAKTKKKKLNLFCVYVAKSLKASI